MDMTIIDLNEGPQGVVEVGAWVEIFGTNAPVEWVAAQPGPIPYEILTGIGPRVERVHV